MGVEHFKVSSAIKSLIGGGLITDNLVAVYELVKNAFDANATSVEIIFQDFSTKTPRIIIKDNGRGMSYSDIVNKWLFLAYSGKRDGTEEEDYRNNIVHNRFYAGAKGVGRFSCDRLGRHLRLISKKNTPNAKTECIEIDWRSFDLDQKKKFEEIDIQHSTLKQDRFDGGHGTILEISEIDPSEWNRKNLLKLKETLSKLIRPDLNPSVQQKKFEIELIVPHELGSDKEIIKESKEKETDEREGYIYSKTVNGKIKNFIFDYLGIRTTKITSTISPDGKRITTELYDRNTFLYELVEKNNYPLIRNLSITLYFLNTSAKNIFKRKMGVDAVSYGNIFVYKNGFRIYPYGERRDDSLGIDNRAGQGIKRYIGLRSLIGQIDIGHQNSNLIEATSRDAGLVKNKEYQELVNPDDGFLITTLRRLEKFAVEITEWGINDDSYNLKNQKEAKEKLVKLISNIYDDHNIISLKFNRDIINIIDQKGDKSAKKLLGNLKRLAASSNDAELVKDTKRLEKTLNDQAKAINTASKTIESKSKENATLKSQLDEQQSETLFARSILTNETKELLSIQHHIYRHSAQHIAHFINSLLDAINSNASKEKLIELTDKIALENQKIITLSRFVTKANFDTTTSKITVDLVNFVNEYVLNVYQEYRHLAMNNQKVKITITKQPEKAFKTTFKPIEIIIILDNILNNAYKAKATKIELTWQTLNTSEIELRIKDNGIGVPEKNIDKIFDFRFSTTDGSGLGLYHSRQVIEKMGGTISISNKYKNGAEFILNFRK